MANCYACKAEIVFDNEHVGRNGKKIPLDPATKTPHDCPMRNKEMKLGVDSIAERLEEKDDHGNELDGEMVNRRKGLDLMDHQAEKFVDHTLKGASKVKIFQGWSSDVEEQYNEFLAKNKVKTQGAQFQLISKSDDGAIQATIALYYEETK
jgi:hypothetical protein